WDLSSSEDAAMRRELREKDRQIDREKLSMEEVGIKRMSASDQRLSETSERQQLLEGKLRQYLNSPEFELYQQTIGRQEGARAKIHSLPPPVMALALAHCQSHPEPAHIMVRGNPHVAGEVVDPHFPRLFGDQVPEITPAPQNAHSAGRRRVLADWIASPRNM